MIATGLADVDQMLVGTAPLPRANGELVFDELWQGRALGMGVVVLKRTGTSWVEFRDHLATAIARHGYDPDMPAATAYYTAWLDALESLLRTKGVTTA